MRGRPPEPHGRVVTRPLRGPSHLGASVSIRVAAVRLVWRNRITIVPAGAMDCIGMTDGQAAHQFSKPCRQPKAVDS
jgi:hypothetical protein